MKTIEEISNILKIADLKITPQRIAVLQAFFTLRNHPTAEEIYKFVTLANPAISLGTIYKTLDTLVEKRIIKILKTDDSKMRYDTIGDRHHHLFCESSGKIIDFYDEDLASMIENYLKNKSIPNFELHDFQLQLLGNFKGK